MSRHNYLNYKSKNYKNFFFKKQIRFFYNLDLLEFINYDFYLLCSSIHKLKMHFKFKKRFSSKIYR